MPAITPTKISRVLYQQITSVLYTYGKIDKVKEGDIIELSEDVVFALDYATEQKDDPSTSVYEDILSNIASGIE